MADDGASRWCGSDNLTTAMARHGGMPWKGGLKAEIIGVGMAVYGGVPDAVVLWWSMVCKIKKVNLNNI